MEVKFLSIDNPGQTAIVNINLDIFGFGAQGSVYRALVDRRDGYCVKALAGVDAGMVANDVDTFRRLRARTLAQLEKPSVVGGIRKELESLYRYLPHLVAYAKLPGYETDALLLAREFCHGTALRDLLVEGPRRSSDVHWRLSLARKICRLMVALDKFGFVHLDPYPDNIFVENTDNLTLMRISLIDLEGIGVLIPEADQTQSTRRWRDAFERMPKAFLKNDYWPLPWWYPTPGKTRPMSDWFVYGAGWQMLSIITLALTWGSTPGCWLDQRALYELQSLAEQLRMEGKAPTSKQQDYMQYLVAEEQFDDGVFAEFVEKCGNEQLARRLISWFTAGFVGPHDGRWFWFNASDPQEALNEARV